jgi:putative flippase GtrA
MHAPASRPARRGMDTLLRFGTVGAITTLLDIALFATLTGGAIPPAPANLVSYSCGIVLSYALNRSWTFRVRHSHAQALRFLAATLAGLLLSTALVAALATILPPPVAKLLSVPLVFAWNYLTVRFWAFRR